MAAYKIDPLSDPDARAEVGGTQAHCLNNAGMVAGHASFYGDFAMYGHHAMVWNPRPSMIPLDAVTSFAYGVNGSGDVVGARQASRSFSYGEAFLFRGGVFHALASVFAGEESIATDINNAGVIAAWAGDIRSFHAFTYDTNSGITTDLGVLPGHTESFAHAINNVGQVAGVSVSPSNHRAFLFDGILQDLGPARSANDINDSGQLVGARVVSGASDWMAYRCDTSGGSPQFVDLGLLPGFGSSAATAINNDGDIVGYSFSWGSGQSRAFICRAGRPMQDLNALIPVNSGWELVSASDINDKGQIVGAGTRYGRNRPYLLTPSTSLFRPEAAIDPMALILGGKWYLIWVELHHPHVPKLSDLDVVIRLMPAAERRATLERARRLGDFGKRVETMIAQMMDGK